MTLHFIVQNDITRCYRCFNAEERELNVMIDASDSANVTLRDPTLHF